MAGVCTSHYREIKVEPDHRRVRDVGEFGLIELLRGALPDVVRESDRLEIGIGDDAAIWKPSSGEKVVLTTDSLVDEIHFRLDWTDWESLGHKILAVNVSDLAAMGARPRGAVVTLGLRGEEQVDALLTLYRGMGALARRTGVVIAGGDIVRSPHALTFHVTAFGETRQGRCLTRSGAMPGDVLAVSGSLGAAAAGLRLLELSPDDRRRSATTAELLVEAHLRPEPRVELGAVLLERGATAAMDLSDGLLGDLPKLLAASDVSARIDARSIPVAAAVRSLFPGDWLELALRGGEDYELLFTAAQADWSAIEEGARRVGEAVTRIGEVVENRSDEPDIDLIDLSGRPQTVDPGAFDHFRRT